MSEEKKMLNDSLNSSLMKKDEEMMKNDEENQRCKEMATWIPVNDMENFLENFVTYSDENNVEWEKFSYEIYDENYYREKFPNFDESVIQILAKCSLSKYHDELEKFKLTRKRKEDYTDADFTVKFN